MTAVAIAGALLGLGIAAQVQAHAYLARLRAVARQKAALKSLTFELSVARRAMTSDDVRKLMKTIRQIQRDSGGRLTI